MCLQKLRLSLLRPRQPLPEHCRSLLERWVSLLGLRLLLPEHWASVEPRLLLPERRALPLKPLRGLSPPVLARRTFLEPRGAWEARGMQGTMGTMGTLGTRVLWATRSLQ